MLPVPTFSLLISHSNSKWPLALYVIWRTLKDPCWYLKMEINIIKKHKRDPNKGKCEKWLTLTRTHSEIIKYDLRLLFSSVG